MAEASLSDPQKDEKYSLKRLEKHLENGLNEMRMNFLGVCLTLAEIRKNIEDFNNDDFKKFLTLDTKVRDLESKSKNNRLTSENRDKSKKDLSKAKEKLSRAFEERIHLYEEMKKKKDEFFGDIPIPKSFNYYLEMKSKTSGYKRASLYYFSAFGQLAGQARSFFETIPSLQQESAKFMIVYDAKKKQDEPVEIESLKPIFVNVLEKSLRDVRAEYVNSNPVGPSEASKAQKPRMSKEGLEYAGVLVASKSDLSKVLASQAGLEKLKAFFLTYKD